MTLCNESRKTELLLQIKEAQEELQEIARRDQANEVSSAVRSLQEFLEKAGGRSPNTDELFALVAANPKIEVQIETLKGPAGWVPDTSQIDHLAEISVIIWEPCPLGGSAGLSGRGPTFQSAARMALAVAIKRISEKKMSLK
jgi:hypothetical protein